MSEHCHLSGEDHAWQCVNVSSQHFWCRDCGALGHKKGNVHTGELEWERPQNSFGRRKSTTSFLNLPKPKTRFEREALEMTQEEAIQAAFKRFGHRVHHGLDQSERQKVLLLLTGFAVSTYETLNADELSAEEFESWTQLVLARIDGK